MEFPETPLSGLAVGQVALMPHSTVPALGASGAIAAVMGVFLVTYPRDRIKSILIIFVFVRVTFIPAAVLIGFWFLTQVFNVGAIAATENGGVAYAAHVAGAVVRGADRVSAQL